MKDKMVVKIEVMKEGITHCSEFILEDMMKLSNKTEDELILNTYKGLLKLHSDLKNILTKEIENGKTIS